MSSDDESPSHPLVRGPSVFITRDFSGQPASPTNNGTRRHRFRPEILQSSYGAMNFEFHDELDRIEFDVEDGVPMTPRANNAANFPFPSVHQDELSQPLLNGSQVYNSSVNASAVLAATTNKREPIAATETQPLLPPVTPPVVTPVLPLPSAMPKSIQRGLGMRDIVSDTSHLWLMHQVLGNPVRVRMFPKGAAELIQYTQAADIKVPLYGVKEDEHRRHKRSTLKKSFNSDSSRASKPASTGSCTSTSTISSESSERITETCWVDLQTTDTHEIELLLGMFHLSPSTIECVVEQHTVDHIEHFPTHGYVFVNISCQGIAANNHSIIGCAKVAIPTTTPPQQRSRSGSVASSAGSNSAQNYLNQHFAGVLEQTPQVVVSCIVFPDWILTIHKEPFQELGDLVKQIHLDFTLKKKPGKLRRHGSSALAMDHNNPSSTTASMPPIGSGESAHVHAPEKRPSGGGGSPVMRRIMRPAWILCTLVDFVVSNFLPDPTPLLSAVDDVESRVMLSANVSNQRQQRDLGQRIAWLRRGITTHRRVVNSKEQLLAQLLLPAMRTNFIAKRSVNADVYVYCQKQIAKVAERIDAARDMLQSASSNYAAAGQLRITRSSQALEHRMHFMSNITAVLLPPALIASTFGMNVTVPFMSSEGYTDVRAFWVLMGLIVLWLSMFVKHLFNVFLDVRATSASAHESWDADVLFATTKNSSFTQHGEKSRPSRHMQPKVKEFSAWCCAVE
ncbi:bacterial-type metal ion transporter, putative [Bodo saltans]|uniref:Bacterial-type metal ion transporter, putative n=1 Tax=Bodo saltans TaxID=75058 RepID=A0A0S4J7H4_BODSA|nr:bacterial-type metal ion transporter, putative [Bodo saltans]|eukprot:CUG87350.1 bacterial-type metal ion transporter, putative [Bodo saltans]